jgi:hypothetical protein
MDGLEILDVNIGKEKTNCISPESVNYQYCVGCIQGISNIIQEKAFRALEWRTENERIIGI